MWERIKNKRFLIITVLIMLISTITCLVIVFTLPSNTNPSSSEEISYISIKEGNWSIEDSNKIINFFRETIPYNGCDEVDIVDGIASWNEGNVEVSSALFILGYGEDTIYAYGLLLKQNGYSHREDLTSKDTINNRTLNYYEKASSVDSSNTILLQVSYYQKDSIYETHNRITGWLLQNS